MRDVRVLRVVAVLAALAAIAVAVLGLGLPLVISCVGAGLICALLDTGDAFSGS